MSSTASVQTRQRALSARTVAEAFRITVENYPNVVAVRWPDDSVSLTWQQLSARVDAFAGGLAELGVRKGDTVALMFINRPEFQLVDIAAMSLGAVPFSLYPTSAPEQIEYIVADSGAKVAVIEEAFAEQFMKARRNLPDLETVVMLEGGDGIHAISFSEVEQANPQFNTEKTRAAIEPSDLLTLIYTSGTTGRPKGVELSHHNVAASTSILGTDTGLILPPESRVISWLPPAHISERACSLYLPIFNAMSVTCCANPREILTVLQQVQPNWFFAVPRVWEKLKAGVEGGIASLPAEKQAQTHAAITTALELVRLRQANQTVPHELSERVAAADAEIFSKLRRAIGLGEALYVHVGAAPTPPEVISFFHAIGLELSELWGLSETAGGVTINPRGQARIGSVGPPYPNVTLKLAPDGEVLVRSDSVMVGYRNMPTETAEAIELIDGERWLHTGDIGEIDEDGYLKIVDRKKELMINSAGKNMSPAMIESTIKSASPLIGQACCIGDARLYNTALLVLDPDFAPVWATQNGLNGMPLSELVTNDLLLAAIRDAVAAANKKLSRPEQIKKFTILADEWLPSGDELTPTMKLKRKPIEEKYRAEIEAMYE